MPRPTEYPAGTACRFFGMTAIGRASNYPDPAAARADAHQRARILRAASTAVQLHSWPLPEGHPALAQSFALDDAAARQESIGNGEPR